MVHTVVILEAVSLVGWIGFEAVWCWAGLLFLPTSVHPPGGLMIPVCGRPETIAKEGARLGSAGKSSRLVSAGGAAGLGRGMAGSARPFPFAAAGMRGGLGSRAASLLRGEARHVEGQAGQGDSPFPPPNVPQC